MTTRLDQIAARLERNAVPDPHHTSEDCRECSDARDIAALLAVVREVAALHRPLVQHYHEAHCPRRFEEQHAEARHTESEYGGEYVCLDMPLGAVCEECRDEDGEHAEYPCPTATAVATLTKEEADRG